MTWAALDDNTHDDPRMTALSHAAFRLYWVATSYAAKWLTDGLLKQHQLEHVAAANRLRKLPVLTNELTTWGLMKRTGELWEIVDWLERNPSAAEVKERREKTQASKVAGGKARAESAARDNGR